jgi:hypothetical protein
VGNWSDWQGECGFVLLLDAWLFLWLAAIEEEGRAVEKQEGVADKAAPAESSSAEAGLPPAQLVVAASAGIACLGAGAVATFVTSNGAGSATLIGAGLGLVVVAFLGNRVEFLKFGGVEAHLQVATQLYRSAQDLEARGHSEAAEELRAQADRLLLQSAPAARAYEEIRRTEPAGVGRMARLYETVHKAEQYSRDEKPSADKVRSLFLKGEEGDRIFAIVLMREDPNVADVGAILDAIANSRSAFEQYQALAAAERLLPKLDPQSRGLLENALLNQTGPGGYITPTTDRWTAAQRMLAVLRGTHSGTEGRAPSTP